MGSAYLMVIDWLEINKVAVEDDVQVDPSQDKDQAGPGTEALL